MILFFLLLLLKLLGQRLVPLGLSLGLPMVVFVVVVAAFALLSVALGRTLGLGLACLLPLSLAHGLTEVIVTFMPISFISGNIGTQGSVGFAKGVRMPQTETKGVFN